MNEQRGVLGPLGKIMLRLGAKPQVYLSDEGKIRVDTLRRSRRKGQINDTELRAGLTELGMPESQIEAIIENERVREVPSPGTVKTE